MTPKPPLRAAAMATALLLTGAVSAGPVLAKSTKTKLAPKRADIVDTAVAAGSFSTLAAALDAAGLVQTLKGNGPFTVFAPTDDAFAALPPGLVPALLKPENKAALTAVLTYHVVSGRVLAKDVVKLKSAKTLNGAAVGVVVSGSTVRVNNATVLKTDVLATNGVIHVIDTVLVPPGLDVASLLARPTTVATATTIGSTPTVPATTAPGARVAVARTVVDIAASDGRFKTLVAAVKAAGLDGVLSGPGPFTVFAPTDTAFGYLDPALLASLLKPENKAVLAGILTYHVIAGKILAMDIAAAPSHRVKTVNGKEVVLTLRGGARINDAAIIVTDIEASNGVIHVIDSVLIPPAG